MWARDFSAYDDDDLTKPFEVAPGSEIEQTYRTVMNNAESRSYYRIDSRMRSGSHHMATYRTSEPGDEGRLPVEPDKFVPDGAGPTFWNSVRPNTDRPTSSLEIPSEDNRLGLPIDAEQGMLLDVHHFNIDDVPILRKVWLNA